MSVRILQGDVIEQLATLPDESVNCVVTSPPYWGLRDYGVSGQIGIEPTIDEYISKMVEVFRGVWRVLRDDGTLWLNLGDSYASAWACSRRNKIGNGSLENGKLEACQNRLVDGLKEKDLIGIPWRVALALQADGWYLRSDIIWHKPNPMPESVTDRPTKSHEYVFLLTKSARYFYDADAVREPHVDKLRGKGEHESSNPHGGRIDTKEQAAFTVAIRQYNPLGRSLRDVWTIPTQTCPQAHFATFPEKLVEPCVKAGTSEKGCCEKCGAPWERQVDIKSHPNFKKDGQKRDGTYSRPNIGGGVANDAREKRFLGWTPTCAHDTKPVPCTVLDPFGGAGTTAMVAFRLKRKVILIEINPKYIAIAWKRIHRVVPELIPVNETKQIKEETTECETC